MKITQWQLNEVKKQLDKAMIPVIKGLVEWIDAKIEDVKKPEYITSKEAFRDMCYAVIHSGGKYLSPKKIDTTSTERFYPSKENSQQSQKEDWRYRHPVGPSIELPALTVDVMKFTGAQAKNERKAQAYYARCEKIRHNSKEAKRIAALKDAKEQVLVNIALRGVDGASEAIEAFQDLCARA